MSHDKPDDNTDNNTDQNTDGNKAPGGLPGLPNEKAQGGDSSVDSPASTITGTTVDARRQPDSLATTAIPAGLQSGVEKLGMFGVHGTGDTSGYGGLTQAPYVPQPAARPYGGYFDEVVDALLQAMSARGIPPDTIEQITVANGELTVYLRLDHLLALFWAVRDEPGLRFEMLSSLSGVDYGEKVPRRLHVVYEMLSLTYRRRMRLEVSVDAADPYVPSAVPVYPTADWHEREAYDMFGVVFAGHPALTRILMPDDWDGHPQRKDYPLGGIPVEYKGAEVPPPDQRRVYS